MFWSKWKNWPTCEEALQRWKGDALVSSLYHMGHYVLEASESAEDHLGSTIKSPCIHLQKEEGFPIFPLWITLAFSHWRLSALNDTRVIKCQKVWIILEPNVVKHPPQNLVDCDFVNFEGCWEQWAKSEISTSATMWVGRSVFYLIEWLYYAYNIIDLDRPHQSSECQLHGFVSIPSEIC